MIVKTRRTLSVSFAEWMRFVANLPFLQIWRADLGERYEQLAAVTPYGIRLPRYSSPLLYDEVLLCYLEMWDYWQKEDGDGEELVHALIEAGNRVVEEWGKRHPGKLLPPTSRKITMSKDFRFAALRRSRRMLRNPRRRVRRQNRDGRKRGLRKRRLTLSRYSVISEAWLSDPPPTSIGSFSHLSPNKGAWFAGCSCRSNGGAAATPARMAVWLNRAGGETTLQCWNGSRQRKRNKKTPLLR